MESGYLAPLKFSTITPLQEQVIRKGICAKCHRNGTLLLVYTIADCAMYQCTKCLTTWGVSTTAN